MYRITAFVMAMAIALTAAVTLVPAQNAAAIPTSSYCLEPVEAEMLGYINEFRAQNGLPALVASQTAGAAADHHSINMANGNFFSHTGQDGSTFDSRMREHGYTFNTFLGENIAAGQASAFQTFVQWRESPGHRANMLNANYSAIGIGRAFNSSSTYGYYWTTTFGGVVDGAACGSPSSPAPQPQPTTAPQPTPTTAPQPAPTQPSAPTGGSRSIRDGGSTSAPAPTAAPSGPAPSRPTYENGPRSIRG